MSNETDDELAKAMAVLKATPKSDHRLWDNYRIICTQPLAAQTELVAAARNAWIELHDLSEASEDVAGRAAAARLRAALKPFDEVEV